MLIRKLTHDRVERARYEARQIDRGPGWVTIVAEWTRPRVDLGFASLNAGDMFYETFYSDRWYNVFEIRTSGGELKGWYADLTRPARITEDAVDWEDLALDMWMSPDGHLSLLDEDEFAAIEPALPLSEGQAVRSTVPALREELMRRWRADMNDRIAAALALRGWTIGTAESCTGGLLGDELTNRAGSSAYFLGGIIAYDNRVKRDLLGVRPETLEQFGAVSEPCAREMAAGARAALKADVGVSVTGIAGPGGGSETKPAGLVYIGTSTPDGEAVQRHLWPHDRVGNKRATADQAMRLILQMTDEK